MRRSPHSKKDIGREFAKQRRALEKATREKAEQGARANDHGCHDPCSEQHGSRQPRSWLILNVRQNTMPGRKAKIPEDMLPFKERLSPEEKKRWVAEWRRLVWHSPRYVAIYAAVVVGA